MLITVAQATAAYTGLKSLFMRGFMPADLTIADMWKLISMTAPSDTEEEEYGWLKNLSFIREWVGDRVLQSLVEANYKIRNRHFEGTIQVPVDKINDRRLGGYAVAAEMLGQNARNFPNRLVFPLLAAGWVTIGLDGQYFFDTNHPVQNPDGAVSPGVEQRRWRGHGVVSARHDQGGQADHLSGARDVPAVVARVAGLGSRVQA
ncbi:Mu-like prophage major head subunit gpT family protein [Paraburkholderia fungorum]|uniref:Mu-like prophage major head subunit gpT family protein n=1 Tax=Paraburkholderia fungorum TaxID=134537 RepID=UPI00402B8426